jgi:regulator of sirC expression with transglutaminase-like and TPR domain
MVMLKKSRLLALLSLLDDPDEVIFKAVEKELLGESSRIISDLEYVWETTMHEICQQRIERLIEKIRYKENFRKLKGWAKHPSPDLLEGFILASKYHFPDINEDRVYRRIEEIRKRIWVELNNSLTSLEKITVLNHILFQEYQFKLVSDNQESLKSHSIAHMLESRQGSGVAFAMLYLVIAGKLELPVRYIDFPRNPLLAYVDRRIAAKVHPSDVETDVLFYINPAGNGSISGRRELEYVLRKLDPEGNLKRLETSSLRSFLMRLLEGMEKTIELSGNSEKSLEIQQMIHILEEKNRSRTAL